MVQSIVTTNDGQVTVASKPGHGTTFDIALPIQKAILPSVLVSQPGEAPRGSETILVVDDDTGVCESTARLLQNHGYSVLSACSAEQAELLFGERRRQIRLLLTDVILPGDTGPELYARLHRQSPPLKVLYMSGYAEGESMFGATFAHAHPRFDKPFSPHALVHRVRQVLDEIG